MPLPTQSDVHVNAPLTNISVAYMQDAAGFVADQTFPGIPVLKQSDLYFKYDFADWNRDNFEKRGPSTESAGGGWKITTDSYNAYVWALHKDVDDQVRANADNPLNMDRDAALWLGQQAMLSREIQWAAAFFTTGIWTGSTTGTDMVGGVANTTDQYEQWDRTNSTPLEDIAAESDAIKLASGYRPNTLIVGAQTWSKGLKNHPEIVDRIKYGASSPTNPAGVTKQAVASLMELDRVLVMDSIQVTSKENPSFETSITTAFIAGKNALLCYVNPTPGIMQPSAGYTFNWTGYVGASAQGYRVSTFRMDWLKSDRVESEMAYAQKVVAPKMGSFLSGIVQ